MCDVGSFISALRTTCRPFLPSTPAEGKGGMWLTWKGRELCSPPSVQNSQRAVLDLFPCSHINSDSFLCDCQLKWLPPWLVEKELQSFVVATCAHPESLKSKSIFAVLPESFVCGKSCLCVLRLYEGQNSLGKHFLWLLACYYERVSVLFWYSMGSKEAQACIWKICHWLQFISHHNRTAHRLHRVNPAQGSTAIKSKGTDAHPSSKWGCTAALGSILPRLQLESFSSCSTLSLLCGSVFFAYLFSFLQTRTRS